MLTVAAVDKMIKKQSLISFVLWTFSSDSHILDDCVPVKAPCSWYLCLKIQAKVSLIFTQKHIIQPNKNNDKKKITLIISFTGWDCPNLQPQ